MNPYIDFRGKRVLVMGLGLHGGGTGVAKYASRHGAEVTVTDYRSEADLQPAIEELRDYPITYVFGQHRDEDFRNCDILEINPAIPPNSPFLKIAVDRGIPVISAIDIIFSSENPRFIGITGSNGKTTTAHFLFEILKKSDPNTLLGGNVGGSLLDVIDDISFGTPIVIELSSFQLKRLAVKKSPVVSLVTNLTPNHLDWHPTLEDYAESKKRIFLYQNKEDTTVLNADSPSIAHWNQYCPGRVAYFSCRSNVDYGAQLKGEYLVLRDGGAERVICKAGEILLPGEHNIENCLASSAAAMADGVSPEMMGEVFRTFRGVHHRLELVEEARGVRFYNDSSSTTPESVIAAIKAFPGPKSLILGGSDKGLSYDKMVRAILSSDVYSVILLGPAGDIIGEVLSSARERATPRIQKADSLDKAVEISLRLVKSGDVVLFSPGCASFDEFRNYMERGDRFMSLVRKLLKEDS